MLNAIRHLWGLHELTWLLQPRRACARAALLVALAYGLFRWQLGEASPGHLAAVIAFVAVPAALIYGVVIANAVAQWEHAQQVFRTPRPLPATRRVRRHRPDSQPGLAE
ncbi:MAG: hypothetical protein IPK37_16685 [Austwickia sp.]|jgi:hypothetical protein|nr:MAG: hypothetical protein IPK37_16685 [Austwickia sp.]